MTVRHLFVALLFAASANASAQCFESSIQTPSPFMGNNGEIFKLVDGTLWEVKYQYEYLYAYYPTVVVCPSRGKLIIDGKSINIEQVGSRPTTARPARGAAAEEIIESSISGEFKGWTGDTIFKLANGQIWQQSSYAYMYVYMYAPAVMIFSSAGGHEMQVDGVSERIPVRRLK